MGDHDPSGTRTRHRTLRSPRRTREHAPRSRSRTGHHGRLQRAPNAAYALVQTALVQDEDARIRDLEGKLGMKPAARPTGSLDGMREAFLGPRAAPSSGPVPALAAGVHRARWLVPQHGSHRRRRRDRWVAAARRHPLDDGAWPRCIRFRRSGLGGAARPSVYRKG